ncbi:hypothetical protein M422DRAFT_30297 [Sphaerobolus stellatus SS14]|uniref:Unplaced genomic scaffold SPHSTscaffold_41, whole genome shotgun sequence n=1 Tax=Sphaerobolus stellatus (strain SS14) TaxID=990650 RepID=A0A0C9VZR0_SPHS4|nr:hypothetical protein M422DRAFT_30297 [Sphaerobolus stellatus SS14]
MSDFLPKCYNLDRRKDGRDFQVVSVLSFLHCQKPHCTRAAHPNSTNGSTPSPNASSKTPN